MIWLNIKEKMTERVPLIKIAAKQIWENNKSMNLDDV
jgi:hypothetical protein